MDSVNLTLQVFSIAVSQLPLCSEICASEYNSEGGTSGTISSLLEQPNNSDSASKPDKVWCFMTGVGSLN